MESDQASRHPAAGPVRVLTVCTGNICRSPMAQYWIRSAIDDGSVVVDSAGTGALVGKPMDAPSRAMTERFGGRPAAHAARQLDEPMLDGVDLVLAMSREHREAVVALRPSLARRAFTIVELERLIALERFTSLRALAATIDTTPQARLAALLDALAARRPDLRADADASLDVVDPYRRGDDVLDRTASQVLPAVETAVELLRTAARSS